MGQIPAPRIIICREICLRNDSKRASWLTEKRQSYGVAVERERKGFNRLALTYSSLEPPTRAIMTQNDKACLCGDKNLKGESPGICSSEGKEILAPFPALPHFSRAALLRGTDEQAVPGKYSKAQRLLRHDQPRPPGRLQAGLEPGLSKGLALSGQVFHVLRSISGHFRSISGHFRSITSFQVTA